MSLGIAILTGGGSGAGLSLESTTVETTSFALPAGKTARIIPKQYKSALVFDDTANGGGTNELMPRLSYVVPNEGTVGTGQNVNFIAPEGYELYGTVWIAGNGLQGGETRIRSFLTLGNGTSNVYENFYSTASTGSWELAFENIPIKGSWALTSNSKAAGNGINFQYEFHPTAESVKDKEFFVSGGASGATITGDEFIVEIYG